MGRGFWIEALLERGQKVRNYNGALEAGIGRGRRTSGQPSLPSSRTGDRCKDQVFVGK